MWAGAIFGAAMVGMVGILPCLLISTDSELLRGGQLTPTLRTMLGFACGGYYCATAAPRRHPVHFSVVDRLLANAFSHLLPEAYRELRQFKKGELRFLGLVPVKPQEPHGFNGWCCSHASAACLLRHLCAETIIFFCNIVSGLCCRVYICWFVGYSGDFGVCCARKIGSCLW